MIQWEYAVVGRIAADKEFLDEMGSHGWELVAATESHLYLKRPKQ